jgi:hypothetical protein
MFFVLSSVAEIQNSIASVAGSMAVSLDIPVAGITERLTKVIQFKFDGGRRKIYLDNLYF